MNSPTGKLQALCHEIGIKQFLEILPQALFWASDEMEEMDRATSDEYRHWANVFSDAISAAHEIYGEIDFNDRDEPNDLEIAKKLFHTVPQLTEIGNKDHVSFHDKDIAREILILKECYSIAELIESMILTEFDDFLVNEIFTGEE
jgi:hypothetical protein